MKEFSEICKVFQGIIRFYPQLTDKNIKVLKTVEMLPQIGKNIKQVNFQIYPQFAGLITF
jgi:hypothetical protein